MTQSELEIALIAEGKSFTDKSTNLDDKDFISRVVQAFNRNIIGALTNNPALQTIIVGAVSESDAAKHFAIMHGYLEAAYIFGWAEDSEPEWAGCREMSWRRWVQYLRIVEGYNRDQAYDFAKRFFYSVDSVEPYT